MYLSFSLVPQKKFPGAAFGQFLAPEGIRPGGRQPDEDATTVCLAAKARAKSRLGRLSAGAAGGHGRTHHRGAGAPAAVVAAIRAHVGDANIAQYGCPENAFFYTNLWVSRK